MSAESARRVLGAVSLFPIVTDSWNRYQEDAPDVSGLQELHKRFQETHEQFSSSSSQIFQGHIGKPHDCTEERIRQFINTELQRPEIRELLTALKPTAEHINKVLEDLNFIFTQEVSVTLLHHTD